MTEHSVPRRTVLGGGLSLGTGLAAGVVSGQAQAQVQRQPPVVNPAIGFLTSMTYSDPLKASFLQGLRDNGWEGDPSKPVGAGNSRVDIVPGEAKGSYDDINAKHDLDNHVVTFSNTSAVKLIVAVGGLAPAHSVQRKSTKPYLVIVGQLPTDFHIDGPNFYGGVNLDTPAGDALRNNYLATKFSINPNEIFLMFNKNSRMTQPELRAWRAHRWPEVQGGAGANGDNDTAQFAKGFNAAKSVAKGVVVSADPYFGHHRDDFVAAANGSQLYVCYPFQHFGGANPKPNSGRSSWYGPDLSAAYKTVGMKAAKLLSAIVAGNPLTFLDLDHGIMAGPTDFPP
jgi:hypothetical protein